jgi:hypothetical protein
VVAVSAWPWVVVPEIVGGAVFEGTAAPRALPATAVAATASAVASVSAIMPGARVRRRHPFELIDARLRRLWSIMMKTSLTSVDGI